MAAQAVTITYDPDTKQFTVAIPTLGITDTQKDLNCAIAWVTKKANDG